jgi:hypothetical protein
MEVRPVNSRLAAATVVEHHYLHRRPPISFAWGAYDADELVGVVTFGVPASRHLQKSACPSAPDKVLELNRLWVHDRMPKNTESQFVSAALRELPPRLVVSYADTAHGHLGYIYRALNFRYAGWTDMDRKTPRYDYLPADPSSHSRNAFRTGYAQKVRRKPKVRYWIPTGNKSDRKALTSLCGWPSMDWRETPPPGEPSRH